MELNSIISLYNFILLDNSALNSLELGKDIKFKGIVDKYKYYEDQDGFMDFLIENADSLNLYLPFLISEEFQVACNHHFPYKEIIKKYGGKLDRERLKLYRIINNITKKRRQLLDRLKDKEKIISFNGVEKELYDELYKTDLEFKNYYNLSEPDFDFLISGVVISSKRETTALLSNDFDILFAWRKILKKRKISDKKLGFFMRMNSLNFKKAAKNF